MVEILLALGVVAIGVCSVMVLFPVGSNATRDSVMEFYAANAADQMLHMIKYNLSLYDVSNGRPYWWTYIYNSNTNTEGSIATPPSTENPPPATALKTLKSTSLFPDNIYDNENEWLEDKKQKNEWEPDPLVATDTLKGGIYKSKSHKDFYQIIIHRGDPDANFVDIIEEDIDFRAIAVLWRQQIQIKPSDPNSVLPYDMGTRLNIEISWPAQLPYNARQKALYTLEIFKQGN